MVLEILQPATLSNNLTRTTSRVYKLVSYDEATLLESSSAPYSLIQFKGQLYKNLEFYSHAGTAPRPKLNQIVIRGNESVIKSMIPNLKPSQFDTLRFIELESILDNYTDVEVETFDHSNN